MTDTTPVFSFPYPEGADLLKDGAVTIQQLAQVIDQRLAQIVAELSPVWFQTTPPTFDPPTSMVDATILVPFNGLDGTGEFAYSAGVVTYTGPQRLFLVGAVMTAHSPGGNAAALVELIVDGVVVSKGTVITYDDTGLNFSDGVIALSGLIDIATGSTLRVSALGNPTTSLIEKRFYAISQEQKSA